MKKFGSFSPKKFKLAFRVPNNCGGYAYIRLGTTSPSACRHSLVTNYYASSETVRGNRPLKMAFVGKKRKLFCSTRLHAQAPKASFACVSTPAPTLKGKRFRQTFLAKGLSTNDVTLS